MWQRLRRWWPIAKYLLMVIIVVAVGRLFVRDLSQPDLWRRHYHPGWLAASGALYVLGLGLSAVYWQRLLRQLGQRPSWPALVRAYYIGHLGKYVPGKAWSLFLRAGLVKGPGVQGGYAVLTTFYEVLTTMASGVLLAAVLFALLLPATSATLDWEGFRRLITLQSPEQGVLHRGALVLLALCLLAPCGVPLVPAVFNRLVHRLSLPFRERDAAPLARVEAHLLPQGLLLTAAGWALLGASLWAALHAVVPELPWSWALWGRMTAYVGVAWVAGFILFVSGGLGVREFFLTLFLAPELVRLFGLGDEEARKTVMLSVVVVRLVWTAAELLMAGAVYWLPAPAAKGGEP
jgi:uncharacterized membrane protein YbhN (UPF0104 family)